MNQNQNLYYDQQFQQPDNKVVGYLKGNLQPQQQHPQQLQFNQNPQFKQAAASLDQSSFPNQQYRNYPNQQIYDNNAQFQMNFQQPQQLPQVIQRQTSENKNPFQNQGKSFNSKIYDPQLPVDPMFHEQDPQQQYHAYQFQQQNRGAESMQQFQATPINQFNLQNQQMNQLGHFRNNNEIPTNNFSMQQQHLPQSFNQQQYGVENYDNGDELEESKNSGMEGTVMADPLDVALKQAEEILDFLNQSIDTIKPLQIEAWHSKILSLYVQIFKLKDVLQSRNEDKLKKFDRLSRLYSEIRVEFDIILSSNRLSESKCKLRDTHFIQNQRYFTPNGAQQLSQMSTFNYGEAIFILKDQYVDYANYTFNDLSKNPACADSIRKTIVSLLNQEGGAIYLGIRDYDTTVEGIDLTSSDMNTLKIKIDQIASPIIPSCKPLIKIQYLPVQKWGLICPGKWVVRICVGFNSNERLNQPYACADSVDSSIYSLAFRFIELIQYTDKESQVEEMMSQIKRLQQPSQPRNIESFTYASPHPSLIENSIVATLPNAISSSRQSRKGVFSDGNDSTHTQELEEEIAKLKQQIDFLKQQNKNLLEQQKVMPPPPPPPQQQLPEISSAMNSKDRFLFESAFSRIVEIIKDVERQKQPSQMSHDTNFNMEKRFTSNSNKSINYPKADNSNCISQQPDQQQQTPQPYDQPNYYQDQERDHLNNPNQNQYDVSRDQKQKQFKDQNQFLQNQFTTNSRQENPNPQQYQRQKQSLQQQQLQQQQQAQIKDQSNNNPMSQATEKWERNDYNQRFPDNNNQFSNNNNKNGKKINNNNSNNNNNFNNNNTNNKQSNQQERIHEIQEKQPDSNNFKGKDRIEQKPRISIEEKKRVKQVEKFIQKDKMEEENRNREYHIKELEIILFFLDKQSADQGKEKLARMLKPQSLDFKRPSPFEIEFNVASLKDKDNTLLRIQSEIQEIKYLKIKSHTYDKQSKTLTSQNFYFCSLSDNPEISQPIGFFHNFDHANQNKLNQLINIYSKPVCFNNDEYTFFVIKQEDILDQDKKKKLAGLKKKSEGSKIGIIVDASFVVKQLEDPTKIITLNQYFENQRIFHNAPEIVCCPQGQKLKFQNSSDALIGFIQLNYLLKADRKEDLFRIFEDRSRTKLSLDSVFELPFEIKE